MRTGRWGATALVVALAACGGSSESAERPRPTTDPVVGWCVEFRVIGAYFANGTADESTMAELENLAVAGMELDHPTIPEHSAAIVEALTWDDQTPLPPAPDPAAMTDALAALNAECH